MMQIHAIQKLPKSFSLTDFANNRKIRYHQGTTAASLKPWIWVCALAAPLRLTGFAGTGMDSIGVR